MRRANAARAVASKNFARELFVWAAKRGQVPNETGADRAARSRLDYGRSSACRSGADFSGRRSRLFALDQGQSIPAFDRLGGAADFPHDEQERTERETDTKEKHGSFWSILRAGCDLREIAGLSGARRCMSA